MLANAVGLILCVSLPNLPQQEQSPRSSLPDGSAALAPSADQTVIVEKVQGVLLLKQSQALPPQEVSRVHGLQAEEVEVPGGIEGLRKVLEPLFLGQPLTPARVIEIKRKIILYYRDHNRPVVTVEVPEQDVTDGVLQLTVIEGRLGQVRCVGNRWFSDSALQGYVQLEPEQAIAADTLLTDVAWINRNPFRHTDLIFTPGDQEGMTDIELVTQDRFPLRLYAGADNTGNTATGQARWYAGFNWGNAFFCDHILSYQFTADPNINRFQAHSIHYTAPLPWRHVLVLLGGYAHIEPEMDKFRSEGHSSQASLRYTMPLKTLYHSYLREFTVGFDFKNTNNNLEFLGENEPAAFASNVNITQLVLSYSHGREIGKHKINLSVEFFYSPGHLVPHQTNHDFHALRKDAKSHYEYGRLTMGDIYTLPHNYSMSGLARIQFASTNLLPSEQFGLGGYDTVRGYDERAVNVDDALCLNFELRSRPWSLLKLFGKTKTKDELLLLAFVDYGMGTNNHPLPREDAMQILIGVGPGLRYKINPYLSARVDWGFKLKNPQFGGDRASKVHIGVLISY